MHHKGRPNRCLVRGGGSVFHHFLLISFNCPANGVAFLIALFANERDRKEGTSLKGSPHNFGTLFPPPWTLVHPPTLLNILPMPILLSTPLMRGLNCVHRTYNHSTKENNECRAPTERMRETHSPCGFVIRFCRPRLESESLFGSECRPSCSPMKNRPPEASWGASGRRASTGLSDRSGGKSAKSLSH